MTFEKYAETNLQGMTDTARRIAQMAWNAGAASCSEIPNSSGQASRQAIESVPELIAKNERLLTAADELRAKVVELQVALKEKAGGDNAG